MDESDEIDTSDVRRNLWENIAALMELHFGGENMARVADLAGFKGGTNMTRLKNQDTDMTIKTIAKLAKAFNLPVWQILAPRLGADLHVIEDKRVVPLFDPGAIRAPAEGAERAKNTVSRISPAKEGTGMRPISPTWKSAPVKTVAKKKGGA